MEELEKNESMEVELTEEDIVIPEEETPDKVIELLNLLNDKFDSKIQNDEWKNKKYDEMHGLMLKYQDDLLAKIVDPLLKSYIQLSDSIKKDIKFFESDENKSELCEILTGINEQIDSILFDYDVEPYTADFGIVDAKEQKIVKTVPTEDENANNCVAEILTTGYKKNGKVFRMERVNIFKYKKAEENNNE